MEADHSAGAAAARVVAAAAVDLELEMEEAVAEVAAARTADAAVAEVMGSGKEEQMEGHGALATTVVGPVEVDMAEVAEAAMA